MSVCFEKDIIIKKSKSLDDDFREHEILKLYAKVKEQLLESQQKQNEA